MGIGHFYSINSEGSDFFYKYKNKPLFSQFTAPALRMLSALPIVTRCTPRASYIPFGAASTFEGSFGEVQRTPLNSCLLTPFNESW